jgi:hypothetical protein
MSDKTFVELLKRIRATYKVPGPDNGPAIHVSIEPPDVVIPIVFPDYLITVDNLSWTDKAAISVVPGVSIVSQTKTASGTRYKVKGLGHAGVLFIEGQTGKASYYEYGRYDPQEKGLVRSDAVPAVTMGTNKRPTKASLTATLQEIAKESGHGTRISAVYIEAANKFAAMTTYATGREAQNSDPNRTPYALTDNNCFTFAKQVTGSAGVDVSMADKRFPSANMDALQQTYPPLGYDPATGVLTLSIELL